MTDLPSLPAPVAAAMDTLNNPRSSARDLSEVLQLDQSLTSRVLRVANSAFYGLPRRIDNLSHAVAILGYGYEAIRDIILLTSLFEAVRQGAKGATLDRELFWAHAVASGAGAKVVGARVGIGRSGEAFLGGLLHDIGKVILDAFLHEEYAPVVQRAREKDLLLIEAEDEVLGANHTDFGHWLAENWNLPHNLTAAVAYHHDPSQSKEHFMMASAVHLGDILARAMEAGHGGDDLIPPVNHRSWAALHLKPALLDKIMTEVEEEISRTQEHLPTNLFH